MHLTQTVSLNMIMTDKSIFHKLFTIRAVSKIYFSPIITSYTLSTILMNNLHMIQT